MENQHINESILSEEILEDQKKNRIDHMTYLPGMEDIGSEIMDQVIEAMEAYDYSKYTAADVKNALAHSERTPEDFRALLSPAALPLLEEIAQAAQKETRKHFGNSVYMFTPIYIANYCENYCIYCGFNCHNKIKRAQLNYEEIEKEGLEQSENMAEEIVDKLTASGVADYVDVTAYSKYVMLNVSGGILFNSGKSELTSEARSLLDKVADALIEYDDNVITIEGHTDSVPINTSLFPNNMMLSLYRAYSVFDFFVSEKGFSDQTMSSSGRGDAVPIATNDTPEGRAQNRRVEIKVYNSINS